MKIFFALSILLNIALTVVVGSMWVGRQVHDHYYSEFAGLVLRESAAQIKQGNTALVREVLMKVKGRPTQSELQGMWVDLREAEKSTTPAQQDPVPAPSSSR